MNYVDEALKYSKGSLYWADMPYAGEDHITRGRRPVVIVSGLKGSLISSLVTVCPLTTSIKDYPCNLTLKYHLRPDVDSQVLCNQITTIPKKNLLDYIGQLPEEDLLALNKTLLESLGFPVSLIEEIQTNLPKIEQANKDAQLLASLVPQAEKLLSQLTEVLSRVSPKDSESDSMNIKTDSTSTRGPRVKRSPQIIANFCAEWSAASNKAEVAKKYNFSGVPSARLFYARHKDKYLGFK